MKNISAGDKKLIKEIQAQLKVLQEQLVHASKLEGKDAYIEVTLKKNQAHSKRIRKEDAKDTIIGSFFIELGITAKQQQVFIPLSIASGKKVAGFMYQIEGTAEGKIATTDIRVRGEGVSQVTVGTLLYVKIPAGNTVTLQIRVETRGDYGKKYKIVFTRIHYKLNVADARYQQYLKEIHSRSI